MDDVRNLLIAIAQANGHEDGTAWADKVLANLAAIENPPAAAPAEEPAPADGATAEG